MGRECKVCGSPTEIVRVQTVTGVDFGPPNDALFELVTIKCDAGHRFSEINEDETVILTAQEAGME